MNRRDLFRAVAVAPFAAAAAPLLGNREPPALDMSPVGEMEASLLEPSVWVHPNCRCVLVPVEPTGLQKHGPITMTLDWDRS